MCQCGFGGQDCLMHCQITRPPCGSACQVLVSFQPVKICNHRELFKKFCGTKQLDCDPTSKSKTVTEEKAQKIKDALNDVERSDVSESFKFWVTKKRKFVLLNYPELDLKDVLCLPAKQRVRQVLYLPRNSTITE